MNELISYETGHMATYSAKMHHLAEPQYLKINFGT